MSDGTQSYGNRGATSSTFLLEVDDVEIGLFSEVRGLQVEVEVETFREGGENGFEHKFPGRMSWPDLVLRGGLTKSDNLFAWMRKTAGEGFEGNRYKLTRSTASVTLMDPVGNRLRSWEIEDAFPVKWNGPELNVNSFAEPQEELVVAHHGFRSKNVSS